MRKICVINHKGGVGKTTTAVSLGAGLAREGRRVLIVDLDPQGNVTTCLNCNAKKDVFDLLFQKAKIKECISNMGKDLDVIPSKETLTKAETLLQNTPQKQYILAQKLKELDGQYDYVILDCPPSLGIMNQNAVLYAEEAFIPVSTDYLSYDALRKMVEAVNDINVYYDHSCKVSKIIPTKFDKRNKTDKEIYNKICNEYYGLVSEPIRVCSKLKEAPKLGMSIFKHAPAARGAKDYALLVKHVIYDEPQ